MPCYDLVCKDCLYAEETFITFEDFDSFFPAKCPNCSSISYNQDYSNKNTICRDGSPKTVGQQAERNKKEMGNELFQKEVDKQIDPRTKAKKKAETPWWRKEGSKPLDLSKVKDIKKYVIKGEKD